MPSGPHLLPLRAARLRAARRALAAAALLAAVAARGEERPSEYAVKAALLANVVKFVEWPAGAAPGGDPRVCSLGADRFAAAVDGAATAARTRKARGAAELSGCAIALLGPQPGEDVAALAEHLAARGILTVADTEGFAAQGVLVNFVVEGDRVRFEVNLPAARRAGFQVSSKLLRLAIVVEPRP